MTDRPGIPGYPPSYAKLGADLYNAMAAATEAVGRAAAGADAESGVAAVAAHGPDGAGHKPVPKPPLGGLPEWAEPAPKKVRDLPADGWTEVASTVPEAQRFMLPPVPSAPAKPTSSAPTHPLLENFIKIGDVDVIGGRVSIVSSTAHCTFAGVAALEHAVRALHKSPAGYTSAPYAGTAVNDTSAGIVLQPTWGDGRYPVYAQLDKMQKVRGLFIDFEAG
jgi:hypothetical protein